LASLIVISCMVWLMNIQYGLRCGDSCCWLVSRSWCYSFRTRLFSLRSDFWKRLTRSFIISFSNSDSSVMISGNRSIYCDSSTTFSCMLMSCLLCIWSLGSETVSYFSFMRSISTLYDFPIGNQLIRLLSMHCLT
jgi:hypothetical protein